MEKDNKEKKWSEVSNETKATIGTIGVFYLLDSLFVQNKDNPITKDTNQILAFLSYILFWIRNFIFIGLPIYIFVWLIVNGVTDQKSDGVTSDSLFYTYLVFSFLMIYSNKMMIKTKQYLSIVLINLLNCWMLYYLYTS